MIRTPRWAVKSWSTPVPPMAWRLPVRCSDRPPASSSIRPKTGCTPSRPSWWQLWASDQDGALAAVLVWSGRLTWSGGAARAALDVVVGEGEHDRAALQRGGRAGEAVRAAALAVPGLGKPYSLEAALLEPRAYLRHQVRLPAAPGPHHGASGRA